MRVIYRHMSLGNSLESCALALLLDLCIGDPPSFPHPVRAIGWLVTRLERFLYRSKHRFVSGFLLLGLVLFVTCVCVTLVLLATNRLATYAQVAMAAVLLWPTIAIRDLFDHAGRVRAVLQKDDILEARLRLSAMVSRDTSRLGKTEIARGCVESVAENLVDGVVSPLFFALLGGPVLAYAFKAVSTLDSMVGYRNERYRQFGWASAKADDLLNFFPARLLFVALPVAAFFVRAKAFSCLKIMLRDGGKNPSPNSGIPEAGFAGALGIQLGGPNAYAGTVIVKPFLNEPGRPAAVNDIRKAQILLLSGALVSFSLLLGLRVLLCVYASLP